MFLALVAAAHAFTLEEAERWPGPSDPRALAFADRAEGLRLVVLGADAVWLVDATAGTPVDAAAQGGNALLVRDPDGDGVSEVWVCADDGLWRLGWNGVTLDTPSQVSTLACSAMVETADGIATAGDPGDGASVVTWVDDGAGGLSGPTDAGFPALVDPLLAFDGADLAAAGRGDAAVQVLGSLGVSTLAAGGAVAGLGVVDGGFAWTLSDTARLAFADGTDAALDAGPTALAAGEIDGDSTPDVLVLHPDAGFVGVWRGATATEVLAPAAVGVVGVASTDRDGDGCAEVAWLEPDDDAVVLAVPSGCGSGSDADGDGWSLDDGDCDDDDPAISPGATELCDGVDDDCDGVVDPPATGVRIDGPDTVDEGSPFTLTGAAEGCPADFAWDVPSLSTFYCNDAGAELLCDAYDDERFGVSVSVLDSDGAVVATADHRVTIENVAPTLVPSGGCAGDLLSTDGVTVHPGEHFEQQVDVNEPGADTVTFEGADLPAGMTLSETGFVVYDVGDTLGTFTPSITLSDEDGGSSSETAVIHVEEGADWGCDESGGSGCGSLCCSSSSAGAVASLLTVLLRRRTLA